MSRHRSPTHYRLRIGVPWFVDIEAHTRMQAVLAQPHDIPWNYERWLERAENQIKDRRLDHRFLLLRIVVDPDVFLAWCERAGIDSDGDALRRYVDRRCHGDEYIIAKSTPRPDQKRRAR